jgi:Co/Zn/Cd efflux system component
VFDPIASLFIAALIVASVVPLVIDSARVLMLELSEEKETELRRALAEVRRNRTCPRFLPPNLLRILVS